MDAKFVIEAVQNDHHVAVTPQRTHAILTKYTSLADFQIKKDDFSPLGYESAGIYTNALLDHCMDYKAMWKQISHVTYKPKGNRASIETGRPGEYIHVLAKIKAMPAAEAEAKSFKLKRAFTETTSQETTQQQALVT
ncbi:hypothetical protein FANTH_12347 [Fusarium anthophilum]|uniref:Uncharacterized protein n=1 Tax=Fusarium anthophilum TaxID=48485 RepID=A0A8H4YTQ3_9HYPO|nr:hypothetical protein FANTH_12347 [Fusarium anthophilum]